MAAGLECLRLILHPRVYFSITLLRSPLGSWRTSSKSHPLAHSVRFKMATNAAYVKAMKTLRDAIDKRHAAIVELVKAGDYDGLVNQIYADKCKTIAPTGETVDGKAAHLEMFKQMDPKNDPWTIKVDECNGEGDWAYVRGTYKCNSDSGKYLTVWKKINDQYYIWNDVGSTSK